MLNVIPNDSHKKIAIESTQKEIKRELRHFTTKKSTNHNRRHEC